jgi:tRNA/tmRNA/rRNA uracil-C5-methylase (TrmA/RlmC/RlmD family)
MLYFFLVIVGGLKPTIVDQEIIQDDKYISHADLADVVQSHEERQPSSHPSWTTADNISQSLEQLRANT